MKQKGVKMYHIKNDKRAIASAELIYVGLCQCLDKKPYEQITISDIQKASTVSRATFYRHFDRIDDVLYWYCNRSFDEVLNSYSYSQNAPMYDFCRHFINYWSENSKILEILMQINRMDIIYNCHIEHLNSIVAINLQNAPFLDKHYEYFLGVRTGVLVGFFMAWLKSGRKESADEVFQIIKEQFEFIRKSELVM